MPSLKITKEQLLDGLRAVGLQRGDVVYVASSLAALGLMPQPVESTLWALREAVGREGTLVMPTFNFGFCRGEPFDRENTPSETGVLSEAFRQLPGAVRTHAPPSHTVAAIGPLASAIGATESLTSFGRQSVFQYLRDINAKHLLIGCGFHEGVAHCHWLEERAEVPYRLWKKFEGEVVLSGQRQHRAFFMFARRTDVNVRVNTDPLCQAFDNAGHVHNAVVGVCRLRAFDLKTFDEFCTPRVAAEPLSMLSEECRAPFIPRWQPVKRIDHIGIVSRYAGKIRTFLSLIECHPQYEGLVAELGVNCQYYGGYNVTLEFVDPTRPDSRVSAYAHRNSTGPLHHIALEVDDVDEALRFFAAKGYTPLDGQFHLGPKPYQRVIFLSPVPTGGLLVELIVNDAQSHPAYRGVL